MAELWKCPACGAPLQTTNISSATIPCPYCGNVVIVPESLRGPAHSGAQAEPTSGYENNPIQNPEAVVERPVLEDHSAEVQQITRLAQAGNQIEAIKRYRQLTGASLREAKDAVDGLLQGRPLEVTQVSLTYSGNPQFSEQLLQLVRAGRKIDAIKLVHDTTHCGLAQAKTVVEAIEANLHTDEPWTPANSPALMTNPGANPAVNVPGVVEVGARKGSKSLGVGVMVVILLAVLLGVLAARTPGGKAMNAPTMVAKLINSLSGYAKVELVFGSKGSGNGQFKDARHIGVDGDGRIYVADYQGGRVQVFDPAGKFLAQWMADRKMPLVGMAVNRDGVVFIAQNGYIRRYDGLSGKLLGELSYADDWGFDDVKTTADGGLVAFWYKNRDDLVRFNNDGKVTVAVKHAISAVAGDPELTARVTADRQGNLYLLGGFQTGVYKYSPTGKFLMRFGNEGSNAGELQSPYAIAVDGKGRIYVSDMKGIQVFRPDGKYLDHFNVEGAAFGMVFDEKGDLYVVTNAQKVFRFKIKGE
jgi:ribosomal protein L7/L12/DNA-binding beta-propeller fold protein YncE